MSAADEPIISIFNNFETKMCPKFRTDFLKLHNCSFLSARPSFLYLYAVRVATKTFFAKVNPE